MHFPAESLAAFHNELGIIRYPSGVEDLARGIADEDGFISRRAMCMLTDNPVADDWLLRCRVLVDKPD